MAKKKDNRNTWTKKDITKLTKLWKRGIVVKEIAKEMDRSVTSVTARLYKLRKDGKIEGRQKRTKPTYLDEEIPTIRIIKKKIPADPYDVRKFTSSKRQTYVGDGWKAYEKAILPKQERTDTQKAISKVLIELELFLLKKNNQYGDSVFSPIRIFSKADIDEQIRVRIDDKLNRLLQGNSSMETDEDVIKDLIGYLVILLIQIRD